MEYNVRLQFQNKLYQVLIPPEPNIILHRGDKYTLALSPSKEELSRAKDKLGTLEFASSGKSEQWRKYRASTDIYRRLTFIFRRDFGEKNPTNAYLKYFELTSTYFPQSGIKGKVMAFFNAELPGSALTAVNHWMCQGGIPFEWYASSLVGEDGALGDEFKYFQYNRDRWLMTKTNNGDMTNINNILDLENRAGPGSIIGGFDFYSHDAGIDVSGKDGVEQYNEQETANAKIHFGCALAGLLLLKPGGMFIAKQYTFYETFTWNAIIIYAGCFEKFYISKPLTSRPTNSEIYLVGLNFKGISAELREYLLGIMKDWDMRPIISHKNILTSGSIGALSQMCNLVYRQQISMLLDAYELYSRYTPEAIDEATRKHKNKLIGQWINLHQPKTITNDCKIPPF